jgi:DNA polymerase-3 subunit epsilon
MDFVALDVETANPDLASICQIGIVSFSDGTIVDKWCVFINPSDYFDPWNVHIHGITAKQVKNAPDFRRIYPKLKSRIENKVVAIYTPFDRVAVSRAIEKYALPPIDCQWLDVARVVRRAWEKFRRNGYGLASVAAEFEISFEHHNALEDARAAGEILLRAIEHTGQDVGEWLVRAYRPISSSAGSARSMIAREGNPQGPLAGEVLVFTGTLSIPRRQAAELAANAGCSVANSVNRKTTILVVGDQDIRRLAGYDKSSKHRKAEALIAKGQNIRIIGEDDFFRLLGIT